MNAKLESTLLNIAAKEVQAVVMLSVQGQTFRIICFMNEQELLKYAENDGRKDWNCDDVAKICSVEIGQTVITD